MKTPKNYKELSDAMLKLFSDVAENKIPLSNASMLVKTSNSIINIQRAKIMATKVASDNKRIEFFEN